MNVRLVPLVLPTTAKPKLPGDGLPESAAGVCAVPDSWLVAVPPGVALTSSDAVLLPADVGTKTTLT